MEHIYYQISLKRREVSNETDLEKVTRKWKVESWVFKMKHFFAGIGEINLVSYLIAIGIGLAPLFHIFIVGSEVSFGKIVLSIIGILYVIILTIAQIYRRFFYKD